jgi:hypothetical protein
MKNMRKVKEKLNPENAISLKLNDVARTCLKFNTLKRLCRPKVFH